MLSRLQDHLLVSRPMQFALRLPRLARGFLLSSFFLLSLLLRRPLLYLAAAAASHFDVVQRPLGVGVVVVVAGIVFE